MRREWNLRSGLTLPAPLHNGIAMSDVSNSGTPLKATFRIKLNGKTVQFSDNEIFSLLREVQQGYLATNELAHRLHTRIGPSQS